MSIDWNDPNWWSALSAGLAFLVALVSLGAAIVSNRTAARSAAADELASRLAKGLARTCHARWEITSAGEVYAPDEQGNHFPEGYCRATVVNTGEEVAFNVHAIGDVHTHEPVAKIQPGESFSFDYDLYPEEDREVFIEWDRPEEFGDERMRVRRTF